MGVCTCVRARARVFVCVYRGARDFAKDTHPAPARSIEQDVRPSFFLYVSPSLFSAIRRRLLYTPPDVRVYVEVLVAYAAKIDDGQGVVERCGKERSNGCLFSARRRGEGCRREYRRRAGYR